VRMRSASPISRGSAAAERRTRGDEPALVPHHVFDVLGANVAGRTTSSIAAAVGDAPRSSVRKTSLTGSVRIERCEAMSLRSTSFRARQRPDRAFTRGAGAAATVPAHSVFVPLGVDVLADRPASGVPSDLDPMCRRTRESTTLVRTHQSGT
jgi:hypothetical protein